VQQEKSLVEATKHAQGRYGGFSFGGQTPDGVMVHAPLSRGVVFPNGATAAILLTFDVEGTYGNAAGELEAEVRNYAPICRKLQEDRVPATFNVVGQMAEEHGAEFLGEMLEAGCEVASHGYVHDLDKRYGGELRYAGHFGSKENHRQVRDGVRALEKSARRFGRCKVRGIRLPYGHFNEYSYEAIADAGLIWASNVGSDDFLVPGQGFGSQPFQIGLGDEKYPIVEIPLDSQTYDWSIWIADPGSNAEFLKAVQTYCASRGLAWERTPRLGFQVWKKRIEEAVKEAGVFTLLCHPINLTVRRPQWGDPLEEFLFPVVELLGELARQKRIWPCTCAQMADFYRRTSDSPLPPERKSKAAL
jgi:peptidoglycan/xylan/chitin deacetylase (PgdA/CDA1 family)